VVLNFTPPDALTILQAAQKLNIEGNVKLWACSTPCNTDFLAKSLGSKWNGKIFVNAELTPPDGTNTATMNLYKAILSQYGSAVAGGVGSFSQMGFVEAELMVKALQSVTGDYTVASVNAAIKGLKDVNTGMLCQQWTYGDYSMHIPNNMDYTVTANNGQMTIAPSGGQCTLISDVDPQIKQYRSEAGTAPLDPTAYPADGSLFGPDVYPWYRSEDGLNQPMPGPLDVFGPYHESCMNTNYARARSTPAYFQNWDGTTYVIFTGSTKTGTCSTTSTWPSVARLKVQMPGDPTLPSYLTIDAVDQSLIFESPSSPVISSSGPDITSAIIWVIEPHRKRGDSLQGVYPPSLIAVSAQDMTPLSILYTSASTDFPYAGGKYNSVVIAQGTVFTGTDRITAFGLTQ